MFTKFHLPTKIIFNILLVLFLIAAILVAINYKKLKQNSGQDQYRAQAGLTTVSY